MTNDIAAFPQGQGRATIKERIAQIVDERRTWMPLAGTSLASIRV